ncbi:hypothetical protein BDV26DRAFT_274038 [Aspergillus bertholletiae]|uniref:Uncharacterized protein n=1 Tax=Aspergillus bertholletiae TaxID=1226010 RepID=A0A5N7AUG4_9EURO|nr:hypothetical protein BDV26DRAFT_274038 [Aspergillus bertholletiae]
MDLHGSSDIDDFERPWPRSVIDRTAGFRIEENHTLAPRNSSSEISGVKTHDRQHIGNTAVRVLLRTVQHGLWKGSPAALMSFEFFFTFGEDAAARFTRADICFRISQAEAPNPVAVLKTWEVSALCPRKIYGNPTQEEDRQWKYALVAPIVAPLRVNSFGLTPPVDLESAYPKDHRLTISGFRVHDGARWVITENKTQQSGIPDQFTCAMIVPYANADTFSMDVAVTLSTNRPALKLVALPWTREDPIHIPPGQDLGLVMPITDFQELTQDHWRTSAEYPIEDQVNTQEILTHC